MFNPVVIAVIVMMVLCLLKINILIAIMISGIVGGIIGGLGLQNTISILISGMGGNAETALSYILLGTLAAAITSTSIVELLAVKLQKWLKNKKALFVLIIAFIGCFSQNAIPVHIAYIPILIPPLLVVMNKMKLDRRAMACGLTFSVKTVEADIKAENEVKNIKFTSREWFTLLAIAAAFVTQILSGSMPLGGLVGILVLLVTRVIKVKDADQTMAEGIKLMGFIAFVMLVAAGFAEVIKATKAVDALVVSSANLIGGSKLLGAIIMLLIGLGITMGIGTSFGTIPVIATIYVPLGMKLGFSPMAIACLLGTAGALGDAGSPASDSTLGPTAGLNADGQHDHIWDTCVPTFLHYNIPLMIFATIAAMFL